MQENGNRNDGFYLPDSADVELVNQLTRTTSAVIGRIENHAGVHLFSLPTYSEPGKSYSVGSWDFKNPHWYEPSVQIMGVDVSNNFSIWFDDNVSSCALTLLITDIDESEWQTMINNYLMSNPKVSKLSTRERQKLVRDQTKKYGIIDKIVDMEGTIAVDRFHYQIETPLATANPHNYHLLNEGTILNFGYDNGHLVNNHANTLLSMMGRTNKLLFANWFLTGLVNAQSVVDLDEPPVTA